MVSNPENREGRTLRPATIARRARILDAALRCFHARGVEATTIHDIQQAADASIGSLYHHFGSKDGIAEELFIALISAFNDAMLEAFEDCEDGESGIRAVVLQYCRWSTDHPVEARYLHAHDVDFSESARARLKAIHERYIAAVFDRFVPFVTNGEIRELPVDVYVPLISGPVQDYVRRWLSDFSNASPMDVAELFADAAWASVRTPKAAGPG